MAEIEAGNLYDMNKTLVAKHEKIIRGKALTNKIENTVIPYFTEKVQSSSYFMLLCHEKRDYTVFNLCMGQYIYEDKIHDITSALKDCIINRGDIYAIDSTEDGVALEIWIRDTTGEMSCYYLFPYDDAVIEV